MANITVKIVKKKNKNIDFVKDIINLNVNKIALLKYNSKKRGIIPLFE